MARPVTVDHRAPQDIFHAGTLCGCTEFEGADSPVVKRIRQVSHDLDRFRLLKPH